MNDTPTKPIAFVRRYNAWRRGYQGIEQPQPYKIGQTLDALCDHAEHLERELHAWQTELSKVMPPDFKDWWENSKVEWPLVARLVIEGKNRRAEQLERELGSPTDEPDANTTAHARVNWWKDRCDDLNEQLDSERALADRLANTLQVYVRDGVHLGHWMPAGAVILSERALAAWKAARNTETKDD